MRTEIVIISKEKDFQTSYFHKGAKKQIETTDTTSICTKEQRKQFSKACHWKFLVLLKKNSPNDILKLYGGQVKFSEHCMEGSYERFFPTRLALGWESWNTHPVWSALTLRLWISDIKYLEIFKLLHMSGNLTNPYVWSLLTVFPLDSILESSISNFLSQPCLT